MKTGFLFHRGPPGQGGTSPIVFYPSGLRLIPVFIYFAAALFLSGQEGGGFDGYGAEEIPGMEIAGAGAEETSEAPLDAESGGAEEAAEEGEPPDARILEMDIKTSTLKELAAWCRTLGLSEGGGREDLSDRLREYYKLKKPQAETQSGETSNKKTIIIESARTSEYFTLEAVDEEYARLRGDVLVTLKDGEALHRIQAWEILYNRTRNILSASGGVEYIKDEGDSKETFRGESIVVDLDDWSSVFMDSVSERSLKEGDTVYRFSGTMITRDDEEVTILTDSEISTGGVEESYWSIKASKLWLLPGSDWAIFNAILKVGNIPVLYIPFFFYPANEIIFHPVLGTRSREGNFVQTTTYILGRPQASSTSESSISKILGNSLDNEKVREGLFLRSTGKKDTKPNDTRFSILADWYANMGGYLGIETALPRKAILGEQTISAGLGFTRNIYALAENVYSPFSAYTSSSEWNESKFFSFDTPFRYRLEAKGSLSGTYGSINWTLPFYSDKYVNRDFLTRSEEMDWFKLMKEGGKKTEDSTTTATNYLSSYSWQLSGSLSPKVTALNPWVSSLSISNISSSVLFQNRDNIVTEFTNLPNTSPDYSFFYPDKLTILSVSASVYGTPLSIPGAGQTAAQIYPPAAEDSPAAENPFKNIGEPRSPWTLPPAAAGTAAGTADTSADPYKLAPPILSQRFDLPKAGNAAFAIDYSFSPAGASELQFRSNALNWPTRDDVDWNDISSILTSLRADSKAGFTLSNTSGAASSVLRLSGNAAWQSYSHLDEESEDYDTQEERDNAHKRVKAATLFNTSIESDSTFKPFIRDPVWSNTNFQYTLKGLLAKSVFNDSVEDPDWDIEWGEWHREKIETHKIKAAISASIMGKEQNLTLSSDLPPEQNAISGEAAARAWITETTASQKITNPFDEDRKFEPLTFTETLKFTEDSKYRAYQQLVFTPEKDEFTSATSTLTLNGFTANYNAYWSKPYELTDDKGWIQPAEEEEKLRPQALNFGYNQDIKKDWLWGSRTTSFSVSAAGALNFDLQRYSYSKLSFTLGLHFSLTKFLDFDLTTSSENTLVMRYFQDLPFVSLPREISGEKNMFIDFLNSLRFDDEQLRRESGFKLKTFTFSMTHHLGDWTAKANWTISPYRPDASATTYKLNNTFSFVVQWIPISEIKTEILYDKEKLEIK
ncbi:MAG: LPS-assembly protein LptD [Treponema sp.]|jgi:hypothetical protein|nr:LPS-assembly protein LptD [Treponema sp.]